MNTIADHCRRAIYNDPTPVNVLVWEQQAVMVLGGDVYNSTIRLVFSDNSVACIDTPRTTPKVKTVVYDDGSIDPALLTRTLDMFDNLFHTL